MSDLQKAFQNLQPHLVGIRYIESIPIIDVKIKKDWTIPKQPNILITPIEGTPGQYMLHPSIDGVGLDELLQFLETVINANVEKEKKVELFKQKVNELKLLFNDTPLVELQTLKFSFDSYSEEDIETFEPTLRVTPRIEPTTVGVIGKETPQPLPQPVITERPVVEPNIVVYNPNDSTVSDYVPDTNPELSEEEREILAEEERHKNFKVWKESQAGQPKKTKTANSKIELPPRKTIADVIMVPDCECGPDEFCTKCADSKSL